VKPTFDAQHPMPAFCVIAVVEDQCGFLPNLARDQPISGRFLQSTESSHSWLAWEQHSRCLHAALCSALRPSESTSRAKERR